MAITTTNSFAEMVPSQVTTLARGGASFTRNFCATRGEVEVSEGVKSPAVSVEASIVTAAIGTQPHFWAIRASITIFHEPSKTFVTVQDALHDLPQIPEQLKGIVHEDFFWRYRDALTQSSPSAHIHQIVDSLAERALHLAIAVNSVCMTKEETEQALDTDVHRGLGSIQREIEASLRRTIPL
jgi:hypothetical protein